VRRARFVLLSLFRFLLLSVSQLVKPAAALVVRLMTRRVETKGSFAKRQVHAAEELDEETALSFASLASIHAFSLRGLLRFFHE